MANLHYIKSLLRGREHVLDLCQVICEAMQESDMYITKGDYSDFELHFDDNTSMFRLDRVFLTEEDNFTFYMQLRVVGRDGIWDYQYKNVTLDYIAQCLHIYHDSGFSDGNLGFLWRTTVCPKRAIDIGVDPEDYDPYEAENWGDGSDLVDRPVESVYPEDYVPDRLEEEDEMQVVSGDRFNGEKAPVLKSIVPDNISQIRVVTLKHQDQVIAFRFKTDVGAFDMRKSVAQGYGLGGFKTDTFISLQSVGGMLMSESERRRRVCVPDVSDCPEDCQKLMNALFDKGEV